MLEEQLIKNELISEWLAEKRSSSTRRVYLYRIRKFLEYHNMTPEELKDKTPKEARTLALRYQNENRDLANNTLLGRLTAVASFMEFYEKPISWRQKTRVEPRPDIRSHIFTNGDLSRMFEVGNVRDKALLALASSLGWEISGFVNLKRKKLKKLLENAQDNEIEFIYFRDIRQKTGVSRVGCLNPLAIQWCTKYLKLTEDTQKRARTPKKENPRTLTAQQQVSDIFDLTGDGIHVSLRSLAKKANLKLKGLTRFHNIRKWTMSGLSRSGFNEFEVKFFVGKAIPSSDQVYLTTLQQDIEAKYPAAFENYLNLNPKVNTKAVTTLSKELEAKSMEIEELQRRLEGIESSKPQLEALLDRILELERRVSKETKE